MSPTSIVLFALALAPVVLMALAFVLALLRQAHPSVLWSQLRLFLWLSLGASAASLLAHLLASGPTVDRLTTAWLSAGTLTVWMALLVQLLGTVIGVFSARYLQGEPGQHRYIAAFSGVLASVQLLLLANHWLLLIVAWALVGIALRHLLCFYSDRPFAVLAEHKKQLADRVADVLLLAAAGLAWSVVGSGSFSALWAHVDAHGASPALQWSAVLLVLAVILRLALLPVHGWLIQVMEAPTPVSALLHAGVVNLGGFVLIRFAPLLDVAPFARWLLVLAGLATAVLAGLVMLTRISIKVRLAWSTVAQMGFMALEIGLGLYTLAALHLVGHSLYKAHAFLASSSAVRENRLAQMRGQFSVQPSSLWFAPVLSVLLVGAWVLSSGLWLNAVAWPWWWTVIMALAWAPLFWLPSANAASAQTGPWRLATAAGAVSGLTLLALLWHALPLGVLDQPDHSAAWIALLGMTGLYAALAIIQSRPQSLETWRRWSYAGFYVDEYYTRLALWIWPVSWSPSERAASSPTDAGSPSAGSPSADSAQSSSSKF